MTTIPRFDYNFSYWIFTWFLLYYFKYIEYCPNSWLILGIILNLIQLFLMIYYDNPFLYIFIFIFVNLFVKVYPFYLLYNKPYRIKDFLFGLYLFILYSLWLFINKTNFYQVIKDRIRSIKNKEIGTPMAYYIINLLKIIK